MAVFIKKNNKLVPIGGSYKIASQKSGYKLDLLFRGGNDYDVVFTINGTQYRIDQYDVNLGGTNYCYPAVFDSVETIAVDADHFSTTPFAVSDSWFRIRKKGDTSWHSLSSNQTYTLTGDSEMQYGFGACLLKGTMILMANGEEKPIQKIKVGDFVIGYDGKPKRVYKVTGQAQFNNNYCIWYAKCGDETKEIKTTIKHEFYNYEKQKMCYLVDDEDVSNRFDFNEHFVDIENKKWKLVSCVVVEEPCEHYSLWCEDNHYYANGLLCGNRHSKNLSITIDDD